MGRMFARTHDAGPTGCRCCCCVPGCSWQPGFVLQRGVSLDPLVLRERGVIITRALSRRELSGWKRHHAVGGEAGSGGRAAGVAPRGF